MAQSTTRDSATEKAPGVRAAVFPRLMLAVLVLLPGIVTMRLGGAASAGLGLAAAEPAGDTARELADIEDRLERADQRLDENRIGEAREILSMTEEQVARGGDVLSAAARSSLEARVAVLRSLARRKVDSLVDAAAAELEEGETDADRLKERLFMENGLERAEVARLDAAAAPGDSHSGRSVRMQAEAALNEGLDPTRIADPEVREMAYELEQARLDSIRNAERRRRTLARGEEKLRRQREQARLAMQAGASVRKIEGLLDKGNAAEAHTAFGIYEAALRQHLAPAEFEQLRSRVESAHAGQREQTRRAVELAERIRKRIEEDDLEEAIELFDGNRARLAAGLEDELLEELAEDVARAGERRKRGLGRAQSTAARIQGLIAEGSVERAHRLFGRHRDRLERYLPRRVYRTLRTDVNNAFDTMKNKRRWARSRARDIEDEIERDNGAQAYTAFRGDSAELARYLDSAALARLHAEVMKADADYRTNSTAAAKTAKELRAMLGRDEVEETHTRYHEVEDFLHHYLPEDEGIEELGKEIDRRYEILLDKRRRASRVVRMVKGLIAARQGEQAYALYQKEKELLAEYGDAEEVAPLGSAVSRARSEFRKEQAEARRTADKIDKLLSRNDAGAAHETFQGAEKDLEQYLGDRERYVALRDSVRQAYRALQDSTRRATRVLKEIESLIDGREGTRARRLYTDNYALLKEYLDAVTVRSLRKRVRLADARYKSGVKEAGATAGRIERLLAAGKREDACAMFDDARDDLRHYLDEKRYRSLAEKTGEARGSLREEQRTALGYVRKINGLVRRRRGDEAYAEFRKHRAALKKHLPAESYASLSEKATEANKEFTANRAEALATARTVRGRLGRDSVEAAYRLFRDERADLKHYLETRTYRKLEKSVTAPYERRRKRERKARLLVVRLNWMLLRGKSAEARETLGKERELLREHLDAKEYAAVSKKVDEARKRFLAKRREAEGVAGKIYGTLKRGRTDEAHTLYRRNRRDLQSYLKERDYERLSEKVDRAWRELEDKRGQARSYARSIRWLLWRNDAREARKEFRRRRTHLRRYLDKAAYGKLEARVAEAYRERKKR